MPKRLIQPHENNLVRLRLLQADDLAYTLAWRNQEQIRGWFFYDRLITAEQHQAWFDAYRLKDDDFVFIIEDRSNQKPIGQVALYHIDWETQRCEFGRLMIGEAAAAGKGLALAATRLSLEIAFKDLGLKEVYLEVYGDNLRAIAVYQKAGFVLRERYPAELSADGIGHPEIWMMNIYAV